MRDSDHEKARPDRHVGKLVTSTVKDAMIRHTVVFRLVHAEGSAAEIAFLNDSRALATIDGVTNFEQLREVSPKNDFRFGFSMEFADEAAYQHYNTHPVHQAFVRDRWQSEVDDFLEIDYAPLE